jgi:hypothetical protein
MNAQMIDTRAAKIRILEGAEIRHYKTGAAKTLDNGGIVEAQQERYGLYVVEMAGERYVWGGLYQSRQVLYRYREGRHEL